MSDSVGTFRGFRVHYVDKRIEARFEDLTLDDLTPGDVVIRVQWSDINYKDALAATGAGRILRKYPLVAGIDLAGVVVSSTDARYHAGDEVLVTGCDLSETLDGGYAQYARVPAEAVVALPPVTSVAPSRSWAASSGLGTRALKMTSAWANTSAAVGSTS